MAALTYSLQALKQPQRIFLAAIDAALLNHRSKFLPRHFQRDAPSRYAPAYDKSGPRTVKETWAQRWARMTPAQQAARLADLRSQRTGARVAKMQGGMQKAAKLPLVASGQLRAAVISGGYSFANAAQSRTMIIPTPFYVDFWKPGQMHKKAALSVISADEVQAFAVVAEKELQRQIEEKTRGA